MLRVAKCSAQAPPNLDSQLPLLDDYSINLALEMVAGNKGMLQVGHAGVDGWQDFQKNKVGLLVGSWGGRSILFLGLQQGMSFPIAIFLLQ